MTKVETIAQEVEKLSRDELREFSRWFWEFDDQAWDVQIKADAEAGRLNSIAEKALATIRHRVGRVT